MSATPQNIDLIKEQIAYLESQSTLIHEYVGRADAKASWIFAASGAVSVYDLSSLDKFLAQNQHSLAIAVSLALGLFLIAALKCFHAIFPRTNANPSGLRFFGSVAKISSAESFSNRISKLSLIEVRDEIARHNFEASKIGAAKFESVSSAGVFSLCGALLSAVILFL
ncbi:hypothetical protein N9Y45_04010 [Erythrobacter sp.]|nr:hypothetical protein [Erythrobacter sp.]